MDFENEIKEGAKALQSASAIYNNDTVVHFQRYSGKNEKEFVIFRKVVNGKTELTKIYEER